MFNGDLKRRALDRLQKVNSEYQVLAEKIKAAAVELHELRSKASHELFGPVEDFVNRLANTPKSFEKAVGELRLSIQSFDDACEGIKSTDSATSVGGSTAAAARAERGLDRHC